MLSWAVVLSFGNLILSAATAILALSLLVYLLAYNLRSGVARAFSALLACVLLVYSGDVVEPRVADASATFLWLRLQWLGIAFVPAAYLHLSNEVLRMTKPQSPQRQRTVLAAYVIGGLMCVLAFSTDLVVRQGSYNPPISRLGAGPLFWAFTVYYAFTALYGAYNIYQAQRRTLTLAARRRLGYLTLVFIGPAVGLFPYLATTSLSGPLLTSVVLALSLTGNIAVAVALVVIAYVVAHYGAMMPDRVVKRRLIHYLLRGPLLAVAVVAIILTLPKFEEILGLPRDTAVLFTVVLAIIVLELGVNLAKPFIDRLTYRHDLDELAWIQELDERLLTTSDLHQFLSNVLVALCEVLKVPNAFIVSPAGRAPLQLEAGAGHSDLPEDTLARWTAALTTGNQNTAALGLQTVDGHWVRALRGPGAEGAALGILAITARAPEVDLTADERRVVAALIRQAELALEDRQLQQQVFATLQGMMPEIERLQQLGSAIGYSAVDGSLSGAVRSPLSDPNFQTWVKDALGHYWGGPKLTRSPLLQLGIVRDALQQEGGNPAKALRFVLDRAIEMLRPEGTRQLAANDWVLFNIVEMRFVQGKRVREIADQLAMSESDLYRKQRVAIEEVARALALMEVQGKAANGANSVHPDAESS